MFLNATGPPLLCCSYVVGWSHAAGCGWAWQRSAWRGRAGQGQAWSKTRRRMNPTITLVGTAPLLMHGNGLDDPISDDAKRMKRISAKRVKTDEDHIAMRRIEFESGLYLDPEAGPFLPGPNIAKALLNAAKIRRQGPKIERGLILVSPVNPLQYDGPRDVSGLWNAPRFRHVVPAKLNGKATVMRCRPIFAE